MQSETTHAQHTSYRIHRHTAHAHTVLSHNACAHHRIIMRVARVCSRLVLEQKGARARDLWGSQPHRERRRHVPAGFASCAAHLSSHAVAAESLGEVLCNVCTRERLLQRQRQYFARKFHSKRLCGRVNCVWIVWSVRLRNANACTANSFLGESNHDTLMLHTNCI